MINYYSKIDTKECDGSFRASLMEAYNKNKKAVRVFTGFLNLKNLAYEKAIINDVVMYDDGGNVIGSVDHILTAIKPFRQPLNLHLKDIEGKKKVKVRFTGKIMPYIRIDESVDFTVAVNKASLILD